MESRQDFVTSTNAMFQPEKEESGSVSCSGSVKKSKGHSGSVKESKKTKGHFVIRWQKKVLRAFEL
ncbi:hypothetical protein FH972_026412 [Carpinus fangiana]|uniref:Uncharacterized protein n=1 Tax=Carpinus fangiana TaxID=176857 RepID=A0A5N6L493_9ROSI|nr:hypothetical protein FH972_026412 [Carpinus fangiana]